MAKTIPTDILRTKLFIRGELVRQCMDLPKDQRPFNPFNPGDDPRFHQMVEQLQSDVPQLISDLVADTFTA